MFNFKGVGEMKQDITKHTGRFTFMGASLIVTILWGG